MTNNAPTNGYSQGVSLWNAWGRVLVPVILTVFGLATAWFSLENRVSAVEADHEHIEQNIVEIREDVKWMRNNWNR